MGDKSEREKIKLSFPVNAAYVSSARLTASSIANRMGFDIDEVEDIKTAVSEACTYIIKTINAAAHSYFEINFILGKDVMEVNMVTQGSLSAPQPDEMSLLMIRALVDEFDMHTSEKDSIDITMVKKHKASLFA